MRRLTIVLLALALAACASPGAGSTQEPCGLAGVQQSTPGGGTQQGIAQAAEGGQRARTNPVMQDNAPWSPATIWGGGQGNVTAAPQWWTERAMSGAPATTQALHADVQQDAANSAAGVHPLIATLQDQIKSANAALACALVNGDRETALLIMEDRKALLAEMSAASSACRPNVTNNYRYGGEGDNSMGATINQGVASSSGANSRPGNPSANEDVGVDRPTTVEEIQEAAGVTPAVPERTLPPAAPTGPITEAPEPIEGGAP